MYYKKFVLVNVIAVVLQTSDAIYRNSFKAHIFRSSRRVQRVFDRLCMFIQAEIWIIL